MASKPLLSSEIEYTSELIHVRDNMYKRQYRRANGRLANKYYIKTKCTGCGKDILQCRSNYSKHPGVAFCTIVCRAKLQANPDGYTKLKRASHGYIMTKAADHPYCNTTGYVPQHRLVVEAAEERYLTPDEVVHHIDGDIHNNNIENLYLTTKAGHCRCHNSLIKLIKGLMELKAIRFNKLLGVYELCNGGDQ